MTSAEGKNDEAASTIAKEATEATAILIPRQGPLPALAQAQGQNDTSNTSNTSNTSSSSSSSSSSSNNKKQSETQIISDSELTPPLSNRKKKRRGNHYSHNDDNYHVNNNNNNNNGKPPYNTYYGTMQADTDHEEHDHNDDSDRAAAEDEEERVSLLHKATTLRISNVNGGGSNTNSSTTSTSISTSNSSGSRWPRGAPTSTSTSLPSSLRSNKTNNNNNNDQNRSMRSLREHRLNQWLECTIVVLVTMIIAGSTGVYWYYNIHQKQVVKRIYQEAVATHAKAAAERRQKCFNIDWQTACDNLTNKAGARRRQRQRQLIIEEPSHHVSTSSSSSYNSASHQHPYHYGKMKKAQKNNHHRHRSKSHNHKGRSRSHTYSTSQNLEPNASIPISVLEDELLQSDDPAVTYDNNCLKVYRLDINHGQMTFPYHSSQLLRLGGNQTMVLIIQHGALRNSEAYFCSFKQMMLQQTYRKFEDILIIAPDFNYATDDLVHPNDAVWNSSKPWGDWRVGAESDPYGVADLTLLDDEEGMTTITTTTTTKAKTKSRNNNIMNQLFDHTVLRPTISSFDVLDHILAILTDKRLYPNVDKISFVGHSAGGQMVQRYAILSVLAALWFMDTGKGSIDIEFIIANPSSYTYLDPRRYPYNCGTCNCSTNNCTCDKDCTAPDDQLEIPHRLDIKHHNSDRSKFPCYQWNYDRWPYGIGSFTDESDDGTLLHTVPYALRDGFVGVERATRMYRKMNLVYMVGQNDTCNDGLPTCSMDCWKRTNYSDVEWPCFRNDMDTRCPAMLQGPYRRARAYRYMKYLEDLYGEPVHRLHTIPDVGHDASKMFSSEIALKELFD